MAHSLSKSLQYLPYLMHEAGLGTRASRQLNYRTPVNFLKSASPSSKKGWKSDEQGRSSEFNLIIQLSQQMTSSEEVSFIPKSFEVERPLVSIGSLSDLSQELKAKKTNICIAALSIINTMVGGGILVLPNSTQNIGIALSETALTSGAILLFVIGFINLLAGYLLIHAADMTKKASYSDLAYFTHGRCSIFLQGATIFICYYPMIIVYIEIFSAAFADILTKCFGVSQIDSDYFSWYRVGVLSLFLLQFVFILPKQLVQIKVASVFSFIGIFVFTCFITYLLASGNNQYSSEDVEKYIVVQPSFKMLASVAAIVTAYGFQPVVYPVYLGLSDRTPKRGKQFMLIAVILTSVLYTVISILALLCFPNSNLTGNILDTIAANIPGWTPVIPNIVYLVLMAMHIPILVFMTKESILIMIDQCMRRSVSRQQEFLERGYMTLQEGQMLELLPYVSMNSIIYYSVAILLWVGATAIAFFQIPIDFLVNYIGAFGMSLLSFIFPAVYFLSAAKKTQTSVGAWIKFGAWFSLIFGIVSMAGLIAANLIITIRE